MSKQKVALLVPLGPDRENILAGTKTATIRVGNRDCPEDAELVLYCHVEPWVVMADVTSVRRCTLCEVTPEEFTADGYDPASAALRFAANLKPFHPEVALGCIVTVIRFTNVRGMLVDKYRAAALKRLKEERAANFLCTECGSPQIMYEGAHYYCRNCGHHHSPFSS